VSGEACRLIGGSHAASRIYWQPDWHGGRVAARRVGAATWPLAASAQQSVMPVIGYLSPGSPESDIGRVAGLRQGLNETGYVEGRDVAIEYRWGQGQYDRLPALAADLVSRQVAAIVTVGTPSTLAAKVATSTIPTIFSVGVDPVQFGLVASLNRPGGNMTGVTAFTGLLAAKRLELLHELEPSASVIAVLVNPTNPYTVTETRQVREAARSLGLQLEFQSASTESDIDAGFSTLVGLRAGALVISGDSFFFSRQQQLVGLAARYAIPTIYFHRAFGLAGGLITYGSTFTDEWRTAGRYAGRILAGAKPADLPVQQPSKFELVINLKTANALGITIPPSIMVQATEVIE
jgi:putative ABC transport system substrate-binding protein